MVHTLVPMSVKIKIKNFETPARLINHMELSCAVGMACRQASLPCPEGTAGTDLKEFVKSVPEFAAMDFTPAEFPTTGVSEKEFIDKMIALAKAGEDEMEHLKCIFYTWAVFYEADEETTSGIAEFLANAAEIAEKDTFIKSLTCIL